MRKYGVDIDTTTTAGQQRLKLVEVELPMIRNPFLLKLVDMVEQVVGSPLLEWLGDDLRCIVVWAVPPSTKPRSRRSKTTSVTCSPLRRTPFSKTLPRPWQTLVPLSVASPVLCGPCVLEKFNASHGCPAARGDTGGGRSYGTDVFRQFFSNLENARDEHAETGKLRLEGSGGITRGYAVMFPF